MADEHAPRSNDNDRPEEQPEKANSPPEEPAPEPGPDEEQAENAEEPQAGAEEAAQEGEGADENAAGEQEAAEDAPSEEPAAAEEPHEPEEEEEEDEFGIDQKRMTFGEHLVELRGRILICIATVGAAFLLFFLVFRQPLYELLVRPVKRAARRVAAQTAEATGKAAGEEAARLTAETPADEMDLEAVADQVVAKVETAEHRAVVEALTELRAGGSSEPLDPQAVRKAVSLSVVRAAHQVVDPSAFLVADTPTSMFVTSAWFALLAAIALTVPVTGYQVWAFVAPGLKRKERGVVWPILTIGTGLFVVGVVFAYLTVVPIALRFLMSYTVKFDGVRVLWKIRDTVKFEAVLLLVFGVAFEMPLVITALTRVGVISPETIAKNRKYAILGTFVVGALLTPPDIVTQLCLAGPLIVLLEISIRTARLFKPPQTIWEPWDEGDYADAWETSLAPDEGAEPDVQPATEPSEEPAEGMPPEYDADYSYEEDYYYEDEYDPYAYGEEAYRPEPGEEESEALDRLRKDLRRRRGSRRKKGGRDRRGRGGGRPNY